MFVNAAAVTRLLTLRTNAITVGIQEGDYDGDWTDPESLDDDYVLDDNSLTPPWEIYHDDYVLDDNSLTPPWEIYHDDPEKEKILDLEVLKTLVEDIEKAAREIASETSSKRIKFGKLGHLIKPIKLLQSWFHKPHKPLKVPSTDLSLDLGAEIVVQPPAESSEQEE